MSNKLSPVKLEIIQHALSAAAEEMSATIMRTSFSSTVREMLDYSTAVFNVEGQDIAQAARIPMHLNTMAPFLQTILRDYIPAAEWQPGDIVLSNDPYCGGQHLPDVTVFKPVFVEGTLVAFVGAMAHHTDVGGSVPGSYNARATEIFAEGLRIPPTRIMRDGRLVEDVLNLILLNVREPETLRGDLLSQIAALEIGAGNLQRLARRYGKDVIADASGRLLEMSEQGMRAAIAVIPDGTYSFSDIVDDDGITERSYEIAVDIIVEGDEMVLDFSRCSDQATGSINCTNNILRSCVYYAILAGVGDGVPSNSGCYRAVTVKTRKGSVVDCSYPAAVVNRIIVGHRVVNVVFGALALAIPRRIPAAYYGSSMVSIAECTTGDGRRAIYFDNDIGGWGGEPFADGANAFSCGLHNQNTVPLEMIESKYPVVFTAFGLKPDSGGAGRFRGGLATLREWRLEADRAVLSTSGDRFKSQPYGVQGGRPGQPGRYSVLPAGGGAAREVASKSAGIELRKGDRLRAESAGGGGYGSPAERPAAEVQADIDAGYITPAHAREHYGYARSS